MNALPAGGRNIRWPRGKSYHVVLLKMERAVNMHLTTERAQLDGLMIFIAVAEQRGFRAAARRLALTPSAVSQSIRALEIRIGAPLFSRTTRSVSLTEAGERLMVHARPGVEMLKAGLDAASEIIIPTSKSS